MNDNQYKTFAFISYSHRDMTMSKWLQKRLEEFKLPTEIHNEIDAGSRYLRPIFRDQSDLNTGILGDELRRHLEESKFLIVICSKYSAQSQWVSDEVKAFVEMGRLDRIIPVIIPDSGVPERDLFPQYLREYFTKHPDKELLGVNIGEVGKSKALIRVVSKMLDVSFDSLWQRHQRQQRVRIVTASLSTVVTFIIAYLFAVPVEISVDVNMEEANLPKGEEVILNVDGAEYISTTENHHFDNISVPGYKRFSNVDIAVSSQFFTPVDTTVRIGYGIHRSVPIELKRDGSFATFAGIIYDPDMNPLEGVTVTIGDHHAVTNTEGAFSITLPLREQREYLPISLVKEGYRVKYREDESPGRHIGLTMELAEGI